MDDMMLDAIYRAMKDSMPFGEEILMVIGSAVKEAFLEGIKAGRFDSLYVED